MQPDAEENRERKKKTWKCSKCVLRKRFTPQEKHTPFVPLWSPYAFSEARRLRREWWRPSFRCGWGAPFTTMNRRVPNRISIENRGVILTLPHAKCLNYRINSPNQAQGLCFKTYKDFEKDDKPSLSPLEKQTLWRLLYANFFLKISM